MPTLQIQAQLSFNDLLRAVEQLKTSELKKWVSQVITIQAQRRATQLSHHESQRLLKINQPIKHHIQTQYEALIAKRQAETLTPDEYQELLLMTEQIERLEAQRIESLAELAQIRQISLTELM
ncbi:MAG: STAS/SEC14 domain-containing protein [Candidatus Parabeggiatoa sp. nov. 2]|nr:MAG: STAS/SEC14 domain-containing protein [Beggiatoa sp. 4572_84]RKZ48932.1 MAG: STAS/SEC14 domain-containing protein [Gammaproteobacteria bacterium]